jgi:hypothetical protein
MVDYTGINPITTTIDWSNIFTTTPKEEAVATIDSLAKKFLCKAELAQYSTVLGGYHEKIHSEVNNLFNQCVGSEIQIDAVMEYLTQLQTHAVSLSNSVSLENINEEIVTVRKHYDAKLASDHLVITLPNIVLTDGEGTVDFGVFKVLLAPPNYVHINCDNPKNAIGTNVFHPVVKNGSLCSGDGKIALYNALANFRFLDAMDIISNILTTYNADAPYYLQLERWYIFYCCKCDARMSENRQCSCGRGVCDECSSNCSCGNICCSSCRHTCEKCRADTCSKCITTCQRCGLYCCSKCMSDNACESCSVILKRRESRFSIIMETYEMPEVADAPTNITNETLEFMLSQERMRELYSTYFRDSD